MKEHEVRNIVEAAVRRERRFWCSALLIAIVSLATLQKSPVYTKDTVTASNVDSLWKGSARRMLLQDTETETPMSESSEDPLPSAFSEITEQLALLGNALVLLEENNTQTNADILPPAAERVVGAPAPEAEAKVAETPVECNCPPGPKGDSAPEFLSDIFAYDPSLNLLKITASTITINGGLVVEGYTGVKQSLFVGGDPSSGAASTEVGAGTLLMYASEKTGGSPTIAGFSTSASGFRNANLTVLSELYEDAGAKGDAKRVSTRLFN